MPALLLVKSWQGASAEPEGIFFNYKYENINWGKLNNKQKDEYFFEFVKHYLPAGFIEALGSPVQIIIMACITILSGGLLAELQTALAAAGVAMTAIYAKNAIGVIIQANNQKEAARTMQEAKRAAKVMAGCIAKLSLDVLDMICTVAGYVKGNRKIKNEQISQILLSKSSASKENLIKYLECIDKSNVSKKNQTNYAEKYKKTCKWPDEVQIPRKNEFLTIEGNIDWNRWASNGGREGNEISGEDFMPKKGILIDRYGTPNGRYSSPIIDGTPYSYEQRSLPFVEDKRQYHVYEVQYDSILECINNVADENIKKILLNEYKNIEFSTEKNIFSISKIAPTFNQIGGGIQYEFSFTINTLLKIGYLKEL